ncbi:hypothetical protein I3760_01G020100 [Carya illinoinensis]|nr:hypothetical protein I3760_01G020100 [Carya illinoinensis]
MVVSQSESSRRESGGEGKADEAREVIVDNMGVCLLIELYVELVQKVTHNKIHEKETNKHRGKFPDDHHDMMAMSDTISHEAILLSPPTAPADEGVAPPPPPPAHAMITDFRPTTPNHSPSIGHPIHP